MVKYYFKHLSNLKGSFHQFTINMSFLTLSCFSQLFSSFIRLYRLIVRYIKCQTIVKNVIYTCWIVGFCICYHRNKLSDLVERLKADLVFTPDIFSWNISCHQTIMRCGGILFTFSKTKHKILKKDSFFFCATLIKVSYFLS